MKCLSSTFAPFRPFEAWLQLEVGLAAVDGDEQLGPLQPPLAQEQRQHQLGLRVVRQPDVLEWGDKRGQYRMTYQFRRFVKDLTDQLVV